MKNAATSIKKKNRRQKKANRIKSIQPKTDYDKVVPKMSKEEYEEYFNLISCGQWDVRNKTILMGQEAMDRVTDFENKMIEKYK